MNKYPDGGDEPRSLLDVVLFCFENKEFVSQWERLYGKKLTPPPRSAIETMIDQACGHKPSPLNEEAARAFIRFVIQYVWVPLPDECFTDAPPVRK